jgi:hypothetical protein
MAKQVFYITDLADKKWHVVLLGKRRIVGVGDVIDKDENMIILMKYHHFLQVSNPCLLLIMMTQIICVQIMKKVCASKDNRKKKS